MKKLNCRILSTIFSLSISTFAVATPDSCIITNAEFDAGLNHASTAGTPGSWYVDGASPHFVVSGMSAYVADMGAWQDYLDYLDDLDYVESISQNLTDDKAYAMVYQVKFEIDVDGDGQKDHWRLDGDIISGSDWDNNGLIDCIENHPVLIHVTNEVSI
jgi:hypothetical protein